MKVYTFKAPDELIKEVDRLAYLKGVSRSEVIRWALQKYLKEHQEVRSPKRVITIKKIELW